MVLQCLLRACAPETLFTSEMGACSFASNFFYFPSYCEDSKPKLPSQIAMLQIPFRYKKGLFYCEGGWILRPGCPESLWYLCLWWHSKHKWTWPWETCSRWSCFEQGQDQVLSRGAFLPQPCYDCVICEPTLHNLFSYQLISQFMIGCKVNCSYCWLLVFLIQDY